jgi:hypothetical protein
MIFGRVLIRFADSVDEMRSAVYDSPRIIEVDRAVSIENRSGRSGALRFEMRCLRVCRCPAFRISRRKSQMSLIESVADDRPEHPVDVVERLAAVNEWAFDRAEDDEISILVCGVWANYDVSFTWLPEMESLHVSCSFDLKAPSRKRASIGELTQLINEQLWLGHFDLWKEQDLVMFRHALCLAGGTAANDAQCGAVVKAAVNACETYYQAFQFVLWADREPREALAFAAFETRGSA